MGEDVVDDSRLVWMGRGEEGEEEEDRWVGYGSGFVKRRSNQWVHSPSEEDEEEEEAVVPFPLLPPSYCVDFEL